MEAALDDIACCQNRDASFAPLDKLKRVCDDCFREIGENIQKYNSENQTTTFDNANPLLRLKSLRKRKLGEYNSEN